MARNVVLHSPLDPVALATRLRDTLGGRKAKPKKGVTGQGDDQTMMLFVYRGYGGAGSTKFKAVMDPDDAGGTRIEGRFRLERGMECGLILWGGFLSIFLFTGIAICLNGGAWEVGIPFIAISSIMMAVPIGLWWFGVRYSAEDEAAIRQFLADTVQAREI